MKDCLNDKFSLLILGAGIVTSIMTGSIAIGFFVALGISAVAFYGGMLRY